MPPFIVRTLKKTDVKQCITLFHQTVHVINAKDYTKEQLNAWAPEAADMSRWESLAENIAFVAECKGQIVGFGDMRQEGFLDRLFVHKDFQKRGIASAIYLRLENQALKLGLKEILTEVSITAKSFFEKMGYQILVQQTLDVRNEKLINFFMKKSLA